VEVRSHRFCSPGVKLTALTAAHFAILSLRNFGIIIAFAIGLTVLYIAASEFISEAKSKGEVKLYPRKRVPKDLKAKSSSSSDDDIEASAGASGRKPSNGQDEKQAAANIPASSADFSFENLCYDIPVKSGTRRLLDNVDGWVKVRLI
jgi:ATP-binding cassette subfamily G (WHITE) protein 2 (PDR)